MSELLQASVSKQGQVQWWIQPGPLFLDQTEAPRADVFETAPPSPPYKCDAVDVKMICYSHASKIHFHKKGFTFSLVSKVRGFGT